MNRKVTVITDKGIRLGNLVPKISETAHLKQKPYFFGWREVELLSLQSKHYQKGIYPGRSFYHVSLMSKEKRKIKCIIYNPQGFVRALKKLNKIKLLDKKSWERYK